MPENQLQDIIRHNDLIVFSDASDTVIIEILKVGTVHDRGLRITPEMLQDFVKNFKAGVYGSDIQLNLGHNREGEAAGWLRDLYVEDNKLLGQFELTALGIDKIKSKQFRYTSSELSLSHPHYETGDKVKNVLIGVALTNIPAVKGLKAISLSENLQLFLKETSMKDKAKKMYSDLMGKDSVTQAECDEVLTAIGDDDSEEAVNMKKAMKKKMAGMKDKKLSEDDEEEEDKETEKSTKIHLSELQLLKEQNEKNQKEISKLQEEIRSKNLSEKIDKELLLSESVSVGLPPAKKADLQKFMMSLSEDQVDQFVELMTNVQTVDLSTRGSVNAERANGSAAQEETLLAEAQKEAKERAEKSGRSEADCLSEIYKEKGLVK